MIKQFVYLLFFILVFSLAMVALQAPPVPAGPKVPDDIGVRIRNNQLDQARLQNQLLQLAQQYQTAQQTIEHDKLEMGELKNEALKAAKLDASGWDVDVDKLQFVPKPAPPSKPENKK